MPQKDRLFNGRQLIDKKRRGEWDSRTKADRAIHGPILGIKPQGLVSRSLVTRRLAKRKPHRAGRKVLFGLALIPLATTVLTRSGKGIVPNSRHIRGAIVATDRPPVGPPLPNNCSHTHPPS